MDSIAWTETVAALRSEDIETCVAAATSLHENATAENIPALLELLKTGDFFAREAAAWPLAQLAGVSHLSELLSAYQKGFDEGHDNDGFTAALIEIPALFPSEARKELTRLISVSDDAIREHCVWLLEFCEPA